MLGNSGSTFEITREQIEALSYLRSPRTAAVYLGVPEVIVEDVWKAMTPPRKLHSGKIRYNVPDNANLNDLARRTDAETGSARLREAILRSMLRWADNTGTTIDEAARFLVSGQ